MLVYLNDAVVLVMTDDLTLTSPVTLTRLAYERNVNRGLKKHFIVNGRETSENSSDEEISLATPETLLKTDYTLCSKKTCDHVFDDKLK